MKIAFLISAYTDPKQLGNMIGALAAGNHWFFVHVDKKVDIAPFRDSVKGHERVTFVTNRYSVNWGGYRQVRYQMEMLRCAIESGIDFDRVFILTAQDYPLISKRRMWDILQDNPTKEYIIGYSIKGDKRQLECATVYHFFRDAPEWLMLRKVARRIMQALPIRKKPYLTVAGERWQLYKSSSYMCITFGLAKYVYNKVCECKEIGRYFRYAFVPEELVIPTIVFNSPYKENATDLSTETYPGLKAMSAVTYFNYGSQIQVFDENDYDELISSGKMFARKFSSVKSEKLMDMLK